MFIHLEAEISKKGHGRHSKSFLLLAWLSIKIDLETIG